jgi:hypothetical protein
MLKQRRRLVENGIAIDMIDIIENKCAEMVSKPKISKLLDLDPTLVRYILSNIDKCRALFTWSDMKLRDIKSTTLLEDARVDAAISGVRASKIFKDALKTFNFNKIVSLVGVDKILNDHPERRDPLACQEELMTAGLEEFAQL